MREIGTSIRMFVVLTVLTGVIYPLVVTAIAQVAFPHQANGSIISSEGRALGSSLIGQPFEAPKYFWGRPSATSPFPYNAAASSGSNLGPTNLQLIGGKSPDGKPIAGAIAERVASLAAAGSTDGPVPTDLVTASASGLDPHISPEAAEYQVERVARERGLSVEDVRKLVKAHTTHRQLGVLGEPVVNVLELNLALDGVK